jgi:hypothetical protein
MKIFDSLYYAVYRFGRSIGQPELQANACATCFMPGFFYLASFYVYCLLAHKFAPHLLPPKGFKSDFLCGAVILMIISFFVFRKRRKIILAKYGNATNQRFYIWLGAIFTTTGFLLPIFMWFLFRALWS